MCEYRRSGPSKDGGNAPESKSNQYLRLKLLSSSLHWLGHHSYSGVQTRRKELSVCDGRLLFLASSWRLSAQPRRRFLPFNPHQNPQIHVRLSHLSAPVCRSQPSCGSSSRALSNLRRNSRVRKRRLQSQRRVRAAVVFEAFRRRLLVRQSQQAPAAMVDLNTKFLEGVEGKLKNLQLSEAEKKGIRIGKKQACSS